MNKPLIMMTHVCRSWRNLLLSISSLWTQIDFSVSTDQQIEYFLRRSGNQPLDICHYLTDLDDVEPFLSITLHNLFRLRRLSITTCIPRFGRLLGSFSSPAPELEHLEIIHDPNITVMRTKFPRNFGGRMPKLTSLSLHYIPIDLHDFNFPILTRLIFETEVIISVQDLTSFFGRCPSLEFIHICLPYPPQPHTPPPRRRVCLAALQEIILDQTACAIDLFDHLILPKCTEVRLRGIFVDETPDHHSSLVARIHPSSIDYLPVMRGIIKAVATAAWCSLAGPNGKLTLSCCNVAREKFDTDFFTSFSPISISQIRELWVGQKAYGGIKGWTWRQTAVEIHGVFAVLTKVEDLTIVNCQTGPFFVTLGATVEDGVLLPGLRRLTVYGRSEDLDVPALTKCAKARQEHFRPLGEVTVVWEEDPGADIMREVESLREFVGELIHQVGEDPELVRRGRECGCW